jgi:O-antigen/teichoic acid export membrane protein
VTSRAAVFITLHVVFFLSGESSAYIAYALLLSGVVVLLINGMVFNALPTFKIDKYYLKDIFTYAFPLMIYSLGGIGYSHGYRLIISTSLGYHDLALFTLASQIALVYYLTVSSCTTGFYPKAYKKLEEQQGDPRAIRFYLKILLVLGVGGAIVIVPLSYLFLAYFKQGSFYNSTQVLPFLLIGQFFFFLYSYSYILCTFYKKTKILTYAMSVGIICSLLLASLLVKSGNLHGNLQGAAISVMCGLFAQFLFSFLLIQRVIKNPKRNPL